MTDKKKEAPRRVAFTREYFAWADHIATKAAAAYGKAAKEYALAAGEESVLEHTSPDTLAMIKCKLREAEPDEKFSDAELERRARNTSEWKEHRDARFAAIRKAAQKRGEKDFRRAEAERKDRHWKTIQSGLKSKSEEQRRIPSQLT